MNGADLAFAGVAGQRDALRSGEVSARELAELVLERIDRIGPQLNAFRVVRGERVLAQADQADARRAAGAQRPLLGVPVAVKDNIDEAGEVTANGTAAHGGPARADSEYVRRLREAGAVLVGRALCPELSAIGVTDSATFGITRNPWDTDRSPGGSSGGSAAAVAAGLVPAATGSDGAGSIRIPAASCGLFGLKPQRGRLSLAPDAEHWHGMTVYGCLTRGVLDSAIVLDAVAGSTATDADRPPPPPRSFAESARSEPGRLRIALSLRPQAPARVDREVKAAVRATAELLAGAGHEVVERDPAYGDAGPHVVARYLKGIEQDAARLDRPERLQRRTRGLVRLGRAIPAPALERTRAAEARHAARINAIFDHVDVLLTPQTARAAVAAGEVEGVSALRCLAGMLAAYPFTAVWNATGQPAASVPAGLSAGGLPLAVSLVGRPGDEGTLLSLAAQLERLRPWGGLRPPVS